MRTYLKKLGPGIITAALIFGPGSLTINTKLGAAYGYSFIWVIVLAIVFMEAFARMSAKIGMNDKVSFIARIKQDVNKPIAYLVGVGVFLTTASFQAGNTIGAGVAFAELFETPVVYWISAFTLAAISLLFFRSFYVILEKLMIGLVMLMLASFLLTLIMAMPDMTQVLQGLIPTVPSGAAYLVITLTASSFSIVGAFYQAYLIQEKGVTASEKEDSLSETRTGIIILGLLSTMVMVCAAAVLNSNQVEVRSASDLGLALEPLFGSFTSQVFMVGFFAASFSSMVGNATIGGVVLADTFFGESHLSHIRVRSMIILVIVIGAVVAFIFGKLPLQFIIFAQGITVMLVPVTAVIILLFANAKKTAEKLRNNPYLNAIGVLGIGILLLMSAYSVKYILF